ncbi:hypothetical protein T11_11758 [Trichinella zimbabwensis]|uniref:Uncharacterized protein n=1 Tax=Trichinella zimbabwensis TaxID=268475 RepID=A0A0V1I001_9BILA|nr:hypothetical protein T11_11758 [Trichinella zimbabwensis]
MASTAGLYADAVKTAVLRSETHSFAEAIEVAGKEELVASVASVKTDAQPEDEQLAAMVTEATAAAVTTPKEVGEDLAEVVQQLKELLTGNTPAATKRSLPPAANREEEGKENKRREKREQTLLNMRWNAPGV